MPCGSLKESGNQDKSGENGHCAFEDLDHSVLQQPLNLGVTNVKQILKCIQSGSKEVKDIVLNECNIIYECKACDALFRSLANFMYHKRCYCKKHLCEDMVLFQKFEEEEEIITVNPEAPAESPEKTLDNNLAAISNLTDHHTVDLEKADIHKKMESPAAKGKSLPETPSTSKGKSATSSGDKVKAKLVPEKTESSMISRRTRNKNAQPAVKIIMTEDPPIKCAKLISARIMRKNSSEKSTAARNKKESSSDNTNKDAKTKKVTISKFPAPLDKNRPRFPKVLFKSIDSNPHAVYQSSDKKKLSSFGVASNSALQTEVDKEKLIIVLKKDGKSHNSTTSKSSSKRKSEAENQSDFHLTRRKRLLSRNDCNVQELRCLTCNTQFMSLKTLYFHMLSLHSKKRLYYPCPFCKTLFVQMYGVSRHLVAIHNKTKEQISKMRDMIKKKSVWKRIDDVDAPHNTNISPLNYQIQPQSQREVKVVIEPPKPVVNLIEQKREIDLPQNVIKVGKNVTLHQCAKCSRLFGRKSSQVSHEKFCIMNTAIKKENVDDPPPSEPMSPVVSILALPTKSIPTSLKSTPPPLKSTPPPLKSTPPPLKSTPPPMKSTPLPLKSNPPPLKPTPPPLKPTAPPLKSNPPPLKSNPSKPTCVLQITKQENKQVSKSTFEITRNLFECKLSNRPKRRAEKQMHKDFVNSQTLKWRSANRVDTTISNKPPPVVKKKIAKTLEKKVHGFMDAETLNCLKCDKKFSSYSNLRRHVAIHVGWTRFKCKYCDYQAYNKSQCWSHIQKAHAVEEGVEDDDIGKCIVNLVNSSPSKNISEQHTQVNSKCNETSKKFSVKHNSLTNKKMSKKKIAKSSKYAGSGKKHTPSIKKESNVKKEHPDLEKEVQSDSVKEVVESKKETVRTVLPIAKFAKKDITEIKKAKTEPSITITKLSKKEDVDSNEKPQAMFTIQKFPKKEMIDGKKEKTQHIIPIQKLTMPDYKRDSNYKSVTTSNPTTIILSKKIPSSSAQSIVTISPESMSSPLKISPIRTSPRKSEIRSPEDKLITTLVTRSPGNTKITPIQIKLQGRSSSIESSPQDSGDQNYHKKERLISEWFPKKDLSSTTIRRVSAPLIIGLAPASNAEVNAQAKNSVITFEKSSQ